MSRSGSGSDKSRSKYPPELNDHYVIKDTIGSGGFAKVKVARHKMTGEKVAIKVMDKKALEKTDDLPRVALEIKALKDLRHQNISRLYQVLETADKFYLVIEYAPGGELFDYIVARDRLKEDEARVFFRQICCAVAYCHSQGYAHRDLKPENLLLDANQNIKLIDFGLIAFPKNILEERLTTCCGSAAYAAPELIRGEPYLGQPADIWSLGILLYALLCGFLPFDDENTQRLYRLIQRGTYEVPPWLSIESQKLIAALLKHKPDHRLTMDQLLRHTWLLKGTRQERIDPSSVYDKEEDLDPIVVGELAKYHSVSVEEMRARISEWEYDGLSAAYELLRLRRKKGQQIRLPAGKGHLPPQRGLALLNMKAQMKSHASDAEHSHSSLTVPAMGGSEPTRLVASMASIPSNLSCDGIDNDAPESAEALAAASAGAAAAFSSSSSSSSSSSKERRSRNRRGTTGTATAPTMASSTADLVAAVGSSPLGQEAAKESQSVADLRDVGVEEITAAAAAASIDDIPAPGPLKRDARGSGSLRGSFMNLAQSMMSVFGSRNLSQPRKVKGIFNVSTTSTMDAPEVLAEVLRVLHEEGCEVKEKGFVVKAKVFDKDKHLVTMSFEVCKLARMDLTGIRLTRIRGDTWLFKKVTQELLAKMRL